MVTGILSSANSLYVKSFTLLAVAADGKTNPIMKWIESAGDGINGAFKFVLGKGEDIAIGNLFDSIIASIANSILTMVDFCVTNLLNALFTAIIYLMNNRVSLDSPNITMVITVSTSIGLALLALFFVIEFCKKAVYFENMTIESFLKPMFILIIGKIVISNTKFILEKIVDISNLAAGAMYNVGAITDNSQNYDKILDELEKQSTVTNIGNICSTFMATKVVLSNTNTLLLGTVFVSLIAIAVIAVFLAVCICLIVREVEIVILTCVAPIVFSTLASDSTSDIFKKFMKYFCVVCFQTIIIAIGFVLLKDGIVSTLTGGITDGIIDGNTSLDFGKAFLNLILQSFRMIIIGLFMVKAKSLMTKLIG
jgi:hypothetical protein